MFHILVELIFAAKYCISLFYHFLCQGDCSELGKWLVAVFLVEIAWPTTVYSDLCKYTSPTTLTCHGITVEDELEKLDVTKLENIKMM